LDVRRLKNVLMLRKMGVPIAQIRDLFELVGADAEILGNAKAVGILRAHLDLLKSRQAEVADQIRQTSSALDTLVAYLLHRTARVDLDGAKKFLAIHEYNLVEKIDDRTDMVWRDADKIADLGFHRNTGEIEIAMLFIDIVDAGQVQVLGHAVASEAQKIAGQ
jgi:DNA-binding transcriptional MerR regulator